MGAPPLDDAVAEGVYARKQLLSGAGLVAWSHARRFQAAVEFGAHGSGRRVLDYGCGDGSFLAMLLSGAAPPSEAVGADIAADLVEDCRRRLGSRGASFVTLPQLAERAPASFDVIFCMEVLEHVLDTEEILDRLDQLLAPGGALIVSVPVETGLPMVVKQAARRVAGWRGIGDYPGTTPYRPAEWLPTLLAGARQHVRRPVHVNPDGSQFHDHKGFNWMRLREQIRSRFELDRVLSSPFAWLPPHLGTQAWFVASKRDTAAQHV